VAPAAKRIQLCSLFVHASLSVRLDLVKTEFTVPNRGDVDVCGACSLSQVVHFLRGDIALAPIAQSTAVPKPDTLNRSSISANSYVSTMWGLSSKWTENQILTWLSQLVVLLFAMIFRYLPDAKIAWRDVWVGASLTAVLFALGKFVLGLYLGSGAAGSAYGAASSLITLLLWIYYAAQILLFGAEFTQVYANTYGTRVEPQEHAVKIEIMEKVVTN
jgi:hypothetical protein